MKLIGRSLDGLMMLGASDELAFWIIERREQIVTLLLAIDAPPSVVAEPTPKVEVGQPKPKPKPKKRQRSPELCRGIVDCLLAGRFGDLQSAVKSFSHVKLPRNMTREVARKAWLTQFYNQAVEVENWLKAGKPIVAGGALELKCRDQAIKLNNIKKRDCEKNGTPYTPLYDIRSLPE